MNLMVNSKQRRRRRSENAEDAVNSRKFHLTLTEKANPNKDLIKTQYAISFVKFLFPTSRKTGNPFDFYVDFTTRVTVLFPNNCAIKSLNNP